MEIFNLVILCVFTLVFFYNLLMEMSDNEPISGLLTFVLTALGVLAIIFQSILL